MFNGHWNLSLGSESFLQSGCKGPPNEGGILILLQWIQHLESITFGGVAGNLSLNKKTKTDISQIFFICLKNPQNHLWRTRVIHETKKLQFQVFLQGGGRCQMAEEGLPGSFPLPTAWICCRQDCHAQGSV